MGGKLVCVIFNLARVLLADGVSAETFVLDLSLISSMFFCQFIYKQRCSKNRLISTKATISNSTSMSGAKRKGGFRKGVEDQYINSFPLPEEDQHVVQVLGARGASIFEVALNDEEVAKKTSDHLALLPNKYRNVIWIKKKDFLIVDGGVRREEGEQGAVEAGGKVQFIVKAILNKKQIKHIKKSGKWPLYLAADVVTSALTPPTLMIMLEWTWI